MARRLLRSFAGGEIAPEMLGRIDMDKMQTGLAKAQNFMILPHGPARNRSGFRWVMETKFSGKRVRLIPFSYSVDQTLVLEICDGVCRFHSQAGTLLRPAQTLVGISAGTAAVITYTGTDPAVGETLFLDGLPEMPALHRRFVVASDVNTVAKTFVPRDLSGGVIGAMAKMTATAINTEGQRFTSGATLARVYEIVTPWAEAHLAALHYTQSADVLTVVHPLYQPVEISRTGLYGWVVNPITFQPGILSPSAPAASGGGPGGGTATAHQYLTTAISADTLEESEASPASSPVSIDLSVAGNYVEVTPAAVTGALRHNVYKLTSGGLYGYIGQSDGAAFRDNNIAPDMSQTPPESLAPFVGTGNYPGAVTYIEQRRAFACTDNRTQTIWMTRSGTESNLTQSSPLRDDDAIVLTVKAMQQNRIQHLVPLGNLLAFTVGGEFRVFASNSDVLTPTSVTPRAQSFVGANTVQPALAENAVLYAQYLGGHVREFAYSGEGLNGAVYANLDVSVLAPHLFDGFTVLDMAFSRTSSCPMLWVVRSDGVLLGMTYVPAQNVRAWHQHTTDGQFESVACIAENGEDALYAVVKRTINGRQVRYIERLETSQFATAADAFVVDSGLTYSGEPTLSITGLWHLEGKTVVALADGAVVENLTVMAGRVTLPAPASKVHVGLPITGELQTLPLSFQTDEAFGQGSVKNVSKVHLRVSRSGAAYVGPTGGRLVETKRRTTEAYGEAPRVRTGWDHANVPPEWDDDGGVTVRHSTPLPLTVLAMVMDVTTGG